MLLSDCERELPLVKPGKLYGMDVSWRMGDEKFFYMWRKAFPAIAGSKQSMVTYRLYRATSYKDVRRKLLRVVRALGGRPFRIVYTGAQCLTLHWGRAL